MESRHLFQRNNIPLHYHEKNPAKSWNVIPSFLDLTNGWTSQSIDKTDTIICRVFAIYSRLSLANFSSFCYLQSTVTSKFTENLLAAANFPTFGYWQTTVTSVFQDFNFVKPGVNFIFIFLCGSRAKFMMLKHISCSSTKCAKDHFWWSINL